MVLSRRSRMALAGRERRCSLAGVPGGPLPKTSQAQSAVGWQVAGADRPGPNRSVTITSSPRLVPSPHEGWSGGG